MIYCIPIILCILFAVTYDFHRIRSGKKFCLLLLCIILIIISGLRYKVGGDTIRYMETYKNVQLLSSLRIKDLFGQGMMPLCYLFFSTCRSISDNFFFLQFIHAAIVNFVIFSFIRKNTPFVFCTILIYIVWNYLEFNTEIIRESLAISVFLCGIKYLKKKQWIRYYLYCVIALGFHISAIITFIIPFVYFIKFDWKIVAVSLILTLFSTIVYTLVPNFLFYLDILGGNSELMEARYFSDEIQVKNWHAQVIYILKWIIFPLISYRIITKSSLTKFYPYFGCIALMIILTSFSRYSYAFYRLNNYLMPFMWIMCGIAMRGMPYAMKKLSKSYLLCVLIYLLIAFTSIYADYFVTDREDMLKYFPYTSIITKHEVYRPEW